MVGSSFILINKNGQRRLLNISRIVALHNEDILLKGVNREIYWEFPPEQEMIYTIQIDLGGRQKLQYMFDKAEDRDALLDQVIAAISPSMTIDSAPGMPIAWADIARSERPKTKPSIIPDDLTFEDLRSLAMAQLKYLREQAELASAAPASPKPPHVPRVKNKP